MNGFMSKTLFKLHHVGLLVNDIEAEAENFANRLGYRIESETIEDRTQTAFVKFLRQEGATSWLELITPNGEKSKLTSALSQGGGLHHFCYEVDDLNLACANLRKEKMMMVGKPVTAEAFPGRKIAWFIGRNRVLIELLEAGNGPLSLTSILP
jgi:methylmalonyl-CoA/ethylmalonyl-CoA epimerase